MSLWQRLRMVWTLSLSLFFQNLPIMAKTTWHWLIPVFLVELFINGNISDQELETMGTGQWVAFALYSLIFFAVYLLAFSAIGVAWCRLSLLDELREPLSFRFGRREFLFLVNSALLGILAGIVLVALTLVLWLMPMPGNLVFTFVAIFALYMAAYAFGLTVFLRCSFVFPAIAIDRNLGIVEAYRLGSGCGLVMALVSIGFGIVAGLFSYLLDFAVDGLQWIYDGLAGTIFAPVVWWFLQVVVGLAATVTSAIIVILDISVVTVTYRIANEGRGYTIFGVPAANAGGREPADNEPPRK